MKYEEVLNSLKNKNIFYFYGSEKFFIENFINKTKECLSPSFLDFNFSVIDLATTSYNDFSIMLSTLPMMDEFRVIVAKNFTCKENKSCIWTKEEKELFASTLANIPSEIKLIINVLANDRSTKVFKEISKVALVYECERMDHLALTDHIVNLSREKGNPINKSLAQYYVNLCGYLHKDSEMTLGEVDNDIAKLCNHISSKGNLTKEAIEDLVVKTEDFNIFSLLDNILMGNRTKALSLYEQLSKNNTHPLMIFSMITSSISLLAKSKLLAEKGMSVDMIAKELKENPYRIKTLLSNGRRLNKKQALKMLNELNQLDKKYKIGQLLDSIICPLAIMKLTENYGNNY